MHECKPKGGRRKSLPPNLNLTKVRFSQVEGLEQGLEAVLEGESEVSAGSAASVGHNEADILSNVS
jgi:hypothetical protein